MDTTRWRRDPIALFADVVRNPETGKPFNLYPAQVAFLREALTLRADGTLPFPELIFSAPKKSGKTTTGALAMVYVVFVRGGSHAEGYAVANDFDQAQGRVFQACVRIIEASPLLAAHATITANRITFRETGVTITALASDYAGAAGANPSCIVFDETWAISS